MKTNTAFERRIAEEVEAERLVSRQEFINEIAEIRTAAAPKIAAAAKNETAAERAFKDAKAALEETEANYRAAQRVLTGLKAESAGRIRRLETKLINSASQKIDSFITELRHEQKNICSGGGASNEIRHTAAGDEVWSKSMSLGCRIESIVAAAEKAELLKLEPLTDGELEVHFQVMRDELPEIRLELVKG